MSDAATFSAPGSATTGLQGYNLDRKVKNLDPATARFFRRRTRIAAALRRKRRGTLNKDEAMTDAIKQMVETLAKSVTGIVTAGGEQRDELLGKGFEEFGAALAGEIEALTTSAVDEAMAKVAPGGEEPLFKGLGCVGRVANLVSTIANQVEAIKNGGAQWELDNRKNEADPASDEVSEYLDHCLASAELAMRAAVNEHVDVADGEDDGEDDGDSRVLVLKLADGQSQIRVRTSLPEELAKFATDPEAIDIIRSEMAIDVLAKSMDVDSEDLAKLLFEDGDLAKADMDPNDAGMGDPGADDGQGDDQGVDDGDPVQQLNMLGRILAAAMVQLDGIMRKIEGEPADQGDAAAPGADAGAGAGDGYDPDGDGDDDSSPETDTDNDQGSGEPGSADAGSDTSGDTGSDSGGESQDDKKKPPFGKVADPEVGELRKTVSDLQAQLAKLAATPMQPKAILGSGKMLTKEADGAGGQDGAASEDDLAKALDKVTSPEERAHLLYLMSIGRPAQQVLSKYL